MNKSVFAASLAALTLATAGCTTMNGMQNDTEANQTMVERISGQLTYRERIALPPGAQMEIVVMDITSGADSGLVLSREQMAIQGRGVPAPFSIDVSKRNISGGPLYGLRAFIKDAEGNVLFGTSSPVLVDMNSRNADVGTITLVSVSSGDTGLQGMAGIQDGEWRVTQFNNDVAPAPTAPTITFGVDGRAYGSTGCNNFTSEYTLDGNAVSLAPIGVTKRLCDPGLNEQERRFLEVLNSLNRASLSAEGRLILEGAGDLRLVAERSR